MKTKTDGVEQFLLNRITSGDYAPNTKIPSQFKLMQQFNCSRVTIQRALTNLINAGFLHSTRGSGTFVKPGPYSKELKELIVVSKYADNSPDFPFSEMIFQLKTSLPLRWVDEEFFDRNSTGFFHPGQAVIWLLPKEKHIMNMYHLRQRDIPQLLINRTFGDFDFIATDPWSSIREAMEVMKVKKGDDFAIISRVPDTDAPYLTERLLAFYEECLAREVHIPPDALIKCSGNAIADSVSCPDIFASGKFPRRIYITEEVMLTPVIMNASRHHLVLGKDYEIMVFSQGILIPPQPGLYMMHQPMDEFRNQVEKFIGHINTQNKERFRVRLKTSLICSR